MRLKRVFRHLLVPRWRMDRVFVPEVMAAIEQAIKQSERSHRGEIRFAVEASLGLTQLLRNMNSRARAVDVFARLRVWDTEENTGVLIYVQWVDRRVEIVADRGIARQVRQAEWDAVCRRLETAFREGRYGPGAVEAVRRVGELLAGPFPARSDNPDELPNRPVRL